MISTADLSRLPDIAQLRRLMQSLAVLDAIMSPQWQYRYFSFNSRWARGEQMGSMRNGQGDHYFAVFNAAGCWLKGFAHEALMSPYTSSPPKVVPGILDSVPEVFAGCMTEPAFVLNDTTFCIWRRYGDPAWQRGPVTLPPEDDPDGSADLLQYLDGNCQTYQAWAESYYEREVPLTAVRAVYAHEPLRLQTIRALNPELSPEQLDADLAEIGYPAK